MSNIKRLNPENQRNTPSLVISKLIDLAENSGMERFVVVAWCRDAEGVGSEILLGTDTIDRFDLLAASQSLRVSADTAYKLMIEAGLAAGGTIN